MLLVSITCSLETFPSPEAALLKSHVVWPDQFFFLHRHRKSTIHGLPTKPGKSDWLRIGHTLRMFRKSDPAEVRDSWFSTKETRPLGTRMAFKIPALRITNHYPVVWLFSEKRLEAIKTYQRETVLQEFVLNLI